MVDPRAARLQNRETRKQPSLEDGSPLTDAATAAWLSTHNTQVRGLVVGQASAVQAIRTDAHSSKIKIGDSVGSAWANSISRAGRCSDTVFGPLSVRTAAMCPSPWESVWAPTVSSTARGVRRGGRFPMALYRHRRCLRKSPSNRCER